jgi:integrase
LPWAQIAAFMAELRTREGVAARALEFTILTAARTGEVVGARWSEIDLETRTWVIPAARMKSRREHRVPLSPRAIELLSGLYREDGNSHVFIGARTRAGLGNMAMPDVLQQMKQSDVTVHGFRSTFRDWAAESTAHPNHVVEQALAHTISKCGRSRLSARRSFREAPSPHERLGSVLRAPEGWLMPPAMGRRKHEIDKPVFLGA